VRGLLVGIAGLFGAAAFWRRRRKKQAAAELQSGPDPAEELRAKLAETRAESDAPAPEPVATPEPESPLDPEARRKSLHDRTRASIDELK
jgi:hypothetical protein